MNMDLDGRRMLVEVLGSMAYRRMISELKKEVYTEKDYEDLATSLKLEQFFTEMTKKENTALRDIPERLLTHWAAARGLGLDKRELGRVFRGAGTKMRRIPEMFEYANMTMAMFIPACCSAKTESPLFLTPSPPRSRFLFDQDPASPASPHTRAEAVPFIHMSLDSGRRTAEQMLRHSSEGSYLVRPSSNNINYAISLKMNNKVQHILVESLLTNTGQRVTVNKLNYFSSLKDLLDFYHVESIYGHYKLSTIVLPQQSHRIHDVMSSVFVNKFCEGFESFTNGSIDDIAEALDLAENFKIFRIGFEGSNLTNWELGKWLLESWVKLVGDAASLDLFERSICRAEEGQSLWRQLKPFFSPM